jgi:hypothetical protein
LVFNEAAGSGHAIAGPDDQIGRSHRPRRFTSHNPTLAEEDDRRTCQN